MYYKKEFDIENFEFWSGALDRVNDLTPEQLRQLGEHIEDTFIDETPTDTEINDFVWFECDEYLAELKGESENE